MPAARVDDDQPRRLVAHRLGVVRQRAVKQHVVAGPGLHDRLALRDAHASREHEMVLVAGVCVVAGAVARRHLALEDCQVSGDSTVDLGHRPAAAGHAAPGTLAGSHDARREAEQQQRTLLAEQRARAAAEDALAVRDRFLGIASHELKTPVASLQLATESLLRAREQGRLDDGRIERSLTRIRAATDRLGSLVDELLDVSRLSAEGPLLRHGPTDVVALVAEVVGRFAEHDLNDRIRLSAPAEAWIDGDAMRLDQVVTNLLENALKYSNGTSAVDVEIHDRPDAVEIRVADRGIGLEEETKERIFEAFGRGANAEHYQGIGLGLYISQQIVARHGGRIEAEIRGDGPGSVFTVTLPRTGGAA